VREIRCFFIKKKKSICHILWQALLKVKCCKGLRSASGRCEGSCMPLVSWASFVLRAAFYYCVCAMAMSILWVLRLRLLLVGLAVHPENTLRSHAMPLAWFPFEVACQWCATFPISHCLFSSWLQAHVHIQGGPGVNLRELQHPRPCRPPGAGRGDVVHSLPQEAVPFTALHGWAAVGAIDRAHDRNTVALCKTIATRTDAQTGVLRTGLTNGHSTWHTSTCG
jgi:hypothetical protein